MTVSEPKVRPRYSSVTFSCSSVYPVTHVAPQKKPRTTVTTAARGRFGIAASTNSVHAANSIDPEKIRSRSKCFASTLSEASPIAIPMPNAVTRMPHPAAPAASV